MISMEERKRRIESIDFPKLSLRSKCEIIGVCRASIYYKPRAQESSLNLELMRFMDKMYLDHPEYGAERMHTWLVKNNGYEINVKRVMRLYYKVMGLQSLMPGPHTSRSICEHKKYPYLLRTLEITEVNQVWATDITYIPMNREFMYLAALIDVYSRKILHWGLSNTMESGWCCRVLEECIGIYGVPQIINTDQGSQYTSDDFVYRVLNNGIKLSMDGKGRALDNIYIERFWRTIKYEHYIRPTGDVEQLRDGMEWFINWYNRERYHTVLNNQTPDTLYYYNEKNYVKAS